MYELGLRKFSLEMFHLNWWLTKSLVNWISWAVNTYREQDQIVKAARNRSGYSLNEILKKVCQFNVMDAYCAHSGIQLLRQVCVYFTTFCYEITAQNVSYSSQCTALWLSYRSYRQHTFFISRQFSETQAPCTAYPKKTLNNRSST